MFPRFDRKSLVVTRIAKVFLALGAATGFVLLILILALGVIAHERQALARKALAEIAARSGAFVTVKDIDLGISTRGLELVAHDASVAYKGDHAHVRRLLAVIGYRELTRLHVMPLKSVSLTSAVVKLAPQPSSAPFDLRRYLAMSPRVAAGIARVARRMNLMRVAIKPPGDRNAKIAVDLRIDANARRARVTIERFTWNGPPLDGFSAGAAFTVPSAPARAARGSIAFIRRATDRLRGGTTVLIARPDSLRGKIALALTGSGLPGRTSFAGTYSVQQDRLEFDGTLSANDAPVGGEAVSLRITIGDPFSSNPKLMAQAGPLEVKPTLFAHTLGGVTPAITGRAEISAATIALALGPVRNAVAQCHDAACETRRALAAAIGSARASLTIASANLQTGRPGLGAIELAAPLRVTLRDGVANADGLSATAGAIAITSGELNANLIDALNPTAPVITCSLRLFSALDFGRVDLRSRMPSGARNLIPHKGVAYASVSLDAAFVNHGAGFKPQTLQTHVRRGFLWLRDQGHHEAILFGGEASLTGDDLVGAARASLPAGGTVLLRARYQLAPRTVQARLNLNGLNVRRWTDALLRADAVSGLSIAGEANGSAAFEWSPALARPRVSGNVALKTLTLGSRFTTTPIFITAAQAVASNTGVRIMLDHAQVGAGNFNLLASVADFAAPKIDLAVTGQGVDFDVIRTSAPGLGRGHAFNTGISARPVTLHASVRLKRIFIHHVALRDFACEIHGRGSRWELRDLSARSMQGAFKMRAAWDRRTGRVYVTGDAYRINLRQLLGQVSATDDPPVSGLLSARLNAGMALAGGREPEPLCGDSTIVMTNGVLGQVPLLAEIVQLVSVTSWLRFDTADIDTGLPYDRITIRTELTSHALEVRQVRLVSDLLALAGYGKVNLPDRTLDLHVRALPLASLRWLLRYLPIGGSRLGKALNRIFAVRIRVSGPAGSPNVTPELFRNPLDALTDVIDLPLDFVPRSELSDDLMFAPPRTLSYRKDCSPYQW